MNLLYEAAERHAARTAVAWAGGSLTFADLAREAAERAEADLAGLRVGVPAPRSPEEILQMISLLASRAAVVLFGRGEPEGAIRQQARGWRVRWEGHGAAARFTDGRPRLVVPTSGSTGEPRAAVHSVESLSASAEGAAERLEFGPEDRWPLTLPMNHVGGLAVLFRALVSGGMLVLPEDRRDLAAAVRGATHLSLVTTQLVRLLDTWTGPPPPALRVLLMGGSSVPPRLAARARDAGWPVVLSYGLTEMGSLVTATEPGEINSSGRVLPRRKLRISEKGEILVGGDALFEGYLDQEPVGAWHATGDLGHLDAEGCLRVTGRRDNMFISGGENIQPERIEAVLGGVPGVEEAVVVPVADPEFGYRPVAFVGGAWDREALTEAVLANLPKYCLPVDFRAIPASPGIKPRRAELRRAAEAARG